MSTLGKPTILVDADSCPVKEEIVEIANVFSLQTVFIASYNHMKTDTSSTETWKYVDTGKEAVDLYIMNHVKRKDIVVTQDIGLASTLLLREVFVLSPRGNLYDEKDIQTALDMRYLSAKMRRQGKYGKGPKPYTREDRQRFVKKLKEILSNFEGDF